jgi:hypothetical protein
MNWVVWGLTPHKRGILIAFIVVTIVVNIVRPGDCGRLNMGNDEEKNNRREQHPDSDS